MEPMVKIQLNKILLGILGRSEYIDEWWASPNAGFDGKTPNEVYWSGDEGRASVTNYICSFASGEYH